MGLGDFSAFFELMAAFNIGFGGADFFDTVIERKYISISKKINDSVDKSEAKSKFTSVEVSEFNQLYDADLSKPTFFRRISRYITKLEVILQSIKLNNRIIVKYESAGREYVWSIKSLFLIVGFYCMYILLLIGYDQFLIESKNETLKILQYSSFILILIGLLYILVIFIPNFYSKRLRMIWIIILVLFFIAYSMLPIWFGLGEYNFLYPNFNKSNEIFAICCAVSITIYPFLLQIIRAFFHLFYFRIFRNIIINIILWFFEAITYLFELFKRQETNVVVIRQMFSLDKIENKKSFMEVITYFGQLGLLGLIWCYRILIIITTRCLICISHFMFLIWNVFYDKTMGMPVIVKYKLVCTCEKIFFRDRDLKKAEPTLGSA